MGGNIAGAYAAAHPEDVKSLFLVAPAGVVSAEPSDMYRHLLDGEQTPLVAANSAEFDHLLEFVFFKKPFLPFPVKKMLIQEAVTHRPLNTKIFKQFRKPDNIVPLESLLKGRSFPTLIVWGSEDRVLHVSGARILEAAMPKAKAVVMDKVGHIPMVERPRETAEAFKRFLALP